MDNENKTNIEEVFGDVSELEAQQLLSEDTLASRMEETVNPFQRRDSIPRSPVRRAAQTRERTDPVDSDGSLTKEVPFQEEETRPNKKRKARDSPQGSKWGMSEPSAILGALRKKIEDLVDFCKKNNNVHKDIKKLASELNSVSGFYIMENNKERADMKTLKEEILRLKNMEKPPAATACAECQTEEVGQTWAQKPKVEPKIDITEAEFNVFDEIIPVLTKPWERRCYVATKIVKDDPGKTKAGNIVFFADPSPESSSKLTKKMRNLYPELAESEVTRCEGGSYAGVELITRYNETGVGLKTRVRNIIEMHPDASRNEEETLRGMYNMLKEVRLIMEGSEGKEVTVITPLGASADKLRKIAEIVFRKSDIAVNLTATQKAPKDPTLKKVKGKSVALVIDSTTATYADTLRDVKSKITDDSAKNAIVGIRRTARGNLLMTFKEGDTAACKKVGEALGDWKFRIAGIEKEKILKIRDIDALQCEEDVKAALTKELGGLDSDRIEVKSLRPTADGNQIANVALKPTLADKLVEMRRIRIGLSLCRVQERVDPIKCFRCWEYGHRAIHCRGIDRSSKCQKCTEEGHKRARCPNDPYCPLCTAPHEAGSGKCAAFRKALTDTISRKSND